MSIDFVYNTDFELSNKEQVSDWVLRIINSKGYKLGNLVYAFFNDEDLKDPVSYTHLTLPTTPYV